ncbi:hypothetical protein C8R43DRAFT_883040 [Mycena crocata]|nr:hypothetical protein C8R43DRAFT_883040 [Mycena crocata]
MPVSFNVASHSAQPVAGLDSDGLNPRQLLAVACSPQYKKAGKVVGSSFAVPEDGTRSHHITNIIPKPSGFVETIMLAYNQHHALVLRPDDVWLAILAQFNFYVNAHAELLRANFVGHEGKRQLIVEMTYMDDFGTMAREMVNIIHRNVVDPTLRAWVLPTFSTTTPKDTAVSSILMMATLKSYFEYVFDPTTCGIPRVTLEGEKSDWEDILQRLEKLKEYGLEPIAWYHLLVPVLSRFVAAFDDPNAQSNVDFWQKVTHSEGGGSGGDFYSGWITAFSVWSDRGAWLGPTLKSVSTLPESANYVPESLSAAHFWRTYGGNVPYNAGGLSLDGTRFHEVDKDKIPVCYAEVDVLLLSDAGPTDCVMAAGVVGTRVSSSGDAQLSELGKDDTVRPVVGWWMFVKK